MGGSGSVPKHSMLCRSRYQPYLTFEGLWLHFSGGHSRHGGDSHLNMHLKLLSPFWHLKNTVVHSWRPPMMTMKERLGHFMWVHGAHQTWVSCNGMHVRCIGKTKLNTSAIIFSACKIGSTVVGSWGNKTVVAPRRFTAKPMLKWNIVRCYSDLKPNVPTRNCIRSLRSQDLCKWYHTNCGLVMHSSKSH